MKIPYFELINPKGFMVESIGRVHSPILKDICQIGYKVYQYSLTMLLMTPEKYFEGIARVSKSENIYNMLTDEQKSQLNMFTLFAKSEISRKDLKTALSFFIDGEILYNEKHECFLVNAKTEQDGSISTDGIINADNWDQVCNICLQCAYIDPPIQKKPKKYKDEKTRKKFEEFYRKREEYNKQKNAQSKTNPDYELANIISSLATYHNSLNYSNIWELTVYQIHDTFYRQRLKQQVNISDLNYSVWGGKDHNNDIWFKHMT